MSRIKSIAFYLPQFHQVEENNEWWGEGFTEWVNVKKGKPNFAEHYQPHIPRELGYYDLDNVEVMRKQATLAQNHGIYGFCFYYYRFKGGRRILEKPLKSYLTSDINFPFCYCWANENWTKAWDGLNNDILLKQEHGGRDDIEFIIELLDVFKDERYIKVDGKPMVLVYRADLFTNAKKLTNKWRLIAKQAGFSGLHLCAVQFYGIDDPSKYGFDAAVEFPPHKFMGPENKPNSIINMTNHNFSGVIVDYKKIIGQSMQKNIPNYLCYRGIVPSWDNTARRQDTSHIMINSSPNLYKFWLSYLSEYTKKTLNEEQQYIFINAWNEWAEGAHLEPDVKYGLSYLEATLNVVNNKKLDIKDYIFNEKIIDFIFTNMTIEEKEDLFRAFKLTQYGMNSTPIEKGLYSRLRIKDQIRINYPLIYKILLPIYKWLKKLR